jgi:hypothetical protein
VTEQSDHYATPSGNEPPSRPPPTDQPGVYAPAPGSGYPGYAPPPKNGLGTAALVLGIVGLVLFWTVVLGFVLGVLALVFGIIGRKRANRREATNGGMALAGAILGGLAVAGTVAIIAAGAAFFEHNKTAFQKYRDCVNSAQTQQQRQDCADTFSRSIH